MTLEQKSLTSQQIPLFIMAARNNPLINWLNLSFDTFNLLHRWTGRIVVLEALAHSISWAASKVAESGWAAVRKDITGGDSMDMYGFIVSTSPQYVDHDIILTCDRALSL